MADRELKGERTKVERLTIELTKVGTSNATLADSLADAQATLEPLLALASSATPLPPRPAEAAAIALASEKLADATAPLKVPSARIGELEHELDMIEWWRDAIKARWRRRKPSLKGSSCR